MRKNIIHLERFGNKKTSHIDVLIYIPHISEEKNFLSLIRKTARVSLNHISDEMLYRFLRHETDTGTREVSRAMVHYLQYSPFSFAVCSVEIPRGFCDLNRPKEKAIFPLLYPEEWEKIYDEATCKMNNILKNVNAVFHLHTMNNFNATSSLYIDESFSEKTIIEHLENRYNGKRRQCTILTENTLGEYITEKKLDTFLKQGFQEYNTLLEENTAYRFVEGYPCTDIARRIPSSFLEITKGSLSKKAFINAIDTSLIEFDEQKVQFFGKILANVLEKFAKTLYA